METAILVLTPPLISKTETKEPNRLPPTWWSQVLTLRLNITLITKTNTIPQISLNKERTIKTKMRVSRDPLSFNLKISTLTTLIRTTFLMKSCSTLPETWMATANCYPWCPMMMMRSSSKINSTTMRTKKLTLKYHQIEKTLLSILPKRFKIYNFQLKPTSFLKMKKIELQLISS